jgi:hypothetical protein
MFKTINLPSKRGGLACKRLLYIRGRGEYSGGFI